MGGLRAGDDAIQTLDFSFCTVLVSLFLLVVFVQIAEGSFDSALMLAGRFVVGALELGIAHVDQAVLAPVLRCRLPVF